MQRRSLIQTYHLPDDERMRYGLVHGRLYKYDDTLIFGKLQITLDIICSSFYS